MSEKKRIILVVTNDLEGDQRLHKMASSLQKMEWEPFLLGRLLPDSKPLSRKYQTRRLKLLFKKGPAFYLCFNIRIFFYLLFARADLFVANDLDTLAGVWCASILRRTPLVYDSHEYFTEVPELIGRRKIQAIWKSIERRIQPRLKNVITVNESIADMFREQYHQDVTVIMNIPMTQQEVAEQGDLPEGFTDKPIIIYQGAVNIGRGIEELVLAMHHLPKFNLLIVGGGDRLVNIQSIVEEEKLVDRIYFTGRVPFETLSWYTSQAKIGVSLEQDIGLNYRLALPNKLFDYMQAGIPVVASNLPEIGRVVRKTGFGIIVSDYSPESLAESINSFVRNEVLYQTCKQKAINSAADYTWDKQEEVLLRFYSKAMGLNSE